MTETKPLYNSIAALWNVSALVSLVQRVKDRPHGLPGMACFHGRAGLGKSYAATYTANHFQAYCVQVQSEWRGRFFCQSILKEIGLKPATTVAEMVEQIAEHLARFDRVLMIDEADHLVKRNLIELARDIHEASGSPVILIGEETMPQELQKWERVHSRMLAWVGAEPVGLSEMPLLRQIYCPDVTINDDLLATLLRACHGSTRRVCVNLAAMQEFGKVRGLSAITLQDWGKRSFETGEAPAPRRAA
jgi:hypothetical protein